jgi:hypothetical protein
MKSAKELGIEQWELDALLKTREFLQRQHPPLPEDVNSDAGFPDGPGVTRFCMSYPVQAFDCGTAMCIGGFVKIFGQLEIPVGSKITISRDEAEGISSYVESFKLGSSLRDLFYPESRFDYTRITAEQAAVAITNFLEEGDPAWATIEGIPVEEGE